MHPPEVFREVLELSRSGLNDCEVSRRTGIARATVRDIRRRDIGELPSRWAGEQAPRCPRCWRACRPTVVTPGDYAELLAVYLGDGHIVRTGRTHRLRVFLDSKYPKIVEETAALLTRCFQGNRVSRQAVGNMTVLSVYSRHLPCLLPQHGPGLKHSRAIELEDWQQEHVDAHPWRVLKGCIRTDGCSFVNRTGAYEYRSYHFSNKSDGVAGIFVDACRKVGVDCSCNFNEKREIWEIRINRRASVALLEEHIGIKR